MWQIKKLARSYSKNKVGVQAESHDFSFNFVREKINVQTKKHNFPPFF